jgi:hypothetical protein
VGSKHQDFRDAVARIQRRGWRVDVERAGYPMALCPCGRHRKTVSRTPSNPNYWKNLEAWFVRTACEGEERQ